MLGILWLTVWATVGEAFYDDGYWNTPDYGTDNLAFDWQRYVHENFSDNLRTFAESYGREGDDEMTIAKARSKLRMLKIFQHTGSSHDFDSSKGKLLPLTEGAKYCTMGRHTKVDCNHCTCVAGQLYMCTGMMCPEPPGRPQFLSTCREGKKRKIDSCNYCYCQNGHEFCSTKDCRHNHDQYLRDSFCPEGRQRKVDCNRCVCRNGEEYCSNKDCRKKPKPSRGQPEFKLPVFPEKSCSRGQIHIKECDYCTCSNGRWKCLKFCIKEKNKKIRLLWSHCEEGTTRQVDACNYCYCRDGREYCDNKDCGLSDEQYVTSRLRNGPMCIEGSRYKTDSCNFCFCRKGQEYCTYKQCAHTDDKEIKAFMPSCEEGTNREVDSCNYCACINGEEICTKNSCEEKDGDLTYLRHRKECDRWDVKFEKCNRCQCRAHLWLCTRKICDKEPIGIKESETQYEFNSLYLKSCQKGDKREIDGCNKCFCRYGKWFCQLKDCSGGHTQTSGYSQAIANNKFPKFTENSKIQHSEIYGNSDMGENSDIANTENIEIIIYPESDGHLEAKSMQLFLSGCEEGSTRNLDSCNECYCTNNEWFCAIKKCEVPHKPVMRHNYLMPELKNKCKLGKKKKTICHVCRCVYWGWRCTRRSRCRDPQRINDMLRQLEPECQSGDIYPLSACNYCVCDSNQKLICFRDEQCSYATMPLNRIKGLNNRPKCPPGKTTETICHVCKCKPYGWQCTKRLKCRNSLAIHPIAALRQRQLEPECEIGHTYKLSACDSCFCDYNHKLVCHRDEACLTEDSVLRLSDYSIKHDIPRCQIGDRTRTNACNYCWCTWDRKWICSNHTCPMYDRRNNQLIPNESNCTEGSQRQVNACNFCICVNGTEFCTQKPCRDSAPTPYIFSEPECFSGEPLPGSDPCNQCICVNSNIMCTNQSCIQRSTDAVSAPKCVEGHRYDMEDGCNYCICQGGQNFCTARACLVNDRQKDKDAPCSEGDMTSAGDHCNICVCMEGKLTCTNKDCSEMERSGSGPKQPLSYLPLRKPNHYGSRMKKRKKPQGTKQRCSPDTPYAPKNNDPECPNDCICDKNELLCTKRKCDKLKYKQRSPNQLFKHDTCIENRPLPSDDPCNACKCLNGRKVCTVVTCSEQDEIFSDEVREYQWNKGRGIKGNMEKKKSNTFCEPFTFYSPDNNRFCRNCFCLHDGLSLCLLNLCKYSKDIPHNSPQELNEVCTPGETGYPTKCVTCTCSGQSTWVCTREELALCQERDCDEKDEFQMGFHPFCAGCKCSVKEWFCSIQSNSCNDYSNVTCPLGTFILNPKQHCSICLCGGSAGVANNMCFTESKCVRQVISHLKD